MAEIPTLRAGTDGREIRLIISDFGGVICTFDYRIFCQRLAGRTGRTTDQVFAAAFGDRLQREFETGRLSGPAYHRAVMDRLGADVPYEEFFPMYGDIFTEIPATCDLLRRLHARYLLYLLSDTNEIHFGYVRETVGILRVFREFIVSYQVGAMKPDPRIYGEALRRSGLPATACVFVDDRPANVEGAARVGMHALLFQSAEQLAAELTRLGVAVP
ncbi:MAG TPA: HAD family phosphatase [Candidatus Methylomirabilis sp.]